MTHPLLTTETAADEPQSGRPNGDQHSANLHAPIVKAEEPKAKVICEWVNKKGRPASSRPDERLLQILRATRTQTYEQVGAVFGISRQRVGQIIRRWKQYSPVRALRPKKSVLRERARTMPVKKENRVHVVSFRLTDAEFQLLQLRYPEMKSPDRAARGIVTRFLSL
jgi:hypothetical protein